MHIGIHINDTFIAAATTDRNGKAVLIEDESIAGEKHFMNLLKLYIEDEFAYLGDKVDDLLANTYDLGYASNFIETLSDTEKAVYKDSSGISWNAASLIAVYLRKLKTDIQVHKDVPIKSAVVTVSGRYNIALTEALKSAFRMAQIPLGAVIPAVQAALEGYDILNTTNTDKNVLLLHLDHHTLSLSLNTLDEDNAIENTFRADEKELGDQYLQKRFFTLIVQRYVQITGKEMKESNRNFLHIKALVKELIAQRIKNDKLYIPLLCAADGEVIELIVTRAQVNTIIEAYTEEIRTFLKDELHKNNIDSDTIDMVLCSGDTKFFPQLEEQLKTLFCKESLELYNLAPEEVLTKGAALYASTTDKTTDPSLLAAETGAENNFREKASVETGESNQKATLPPEQLIKRIHALHINALGEQI